MGHSLRILIVLFFSISVFGQDKEIEDDTLNLKLPRHSVYLEIGGNGVLYSFNYEFLLINSEYLKFATRVGATIIPVRNSIRKAIAFPLEVNFLVGQDKNFFEIGGGITQGKYVGDNHWDPVLVGRIGFRKIFRTNFITRIGFTPFYHPDWGIFPWGGICLGVTF